MSLSCVNCGSVLEKDSKFCPSCGFQVDVRESREFVEYAPSVNSPEKPVFFSSSPRRRISSSHSHSRGCRRHRPRRQHSGWVLGVVFLSVGLLLALLLLAPLAMYGSFAHDGRMSDFGTSMGDMGGDFGDFFGGLGDSIGAVFDSPFSGHSFNSVIFLLFPVFFFLFGFVLILFAARAHRRSA